ncbi:MAG TPA: MaoC/PaaZ C-terminal domain-containing protein [Hyphomicrobiaceae bacterium]|nr:MaoC/PaaZ C-terminal domain-containing protein [Hyphomicrobiaceae bacterium]
MSGRVADVSVLPGVFALPRIGVSRDEMIAFAKTFDAQPFHIDEAAAQGTLLGELVASAWYVCAQITACAEAVARNIGIDLQLAGVEQILLHAPVRAGDLLSGNIQLGSMEPCECGDGACRGCIDIENQRGENVMRLLVDFSIRQSAGRGTANLGRCKLRQARSVRVQRMPREDVIRHFEYIGIGDEAFLGPYSFDMKTVEKFCLLTFQGAEIAASIAGAGETSVPNWHLPAAWMQCMLRYYEDEAVRFAARGLVVPRLGPAAGIKHLRWARPVSVGETIVFRGWAERKLELASFRDWGLLMVGAEGVDARGNVVVSFCSQLLIERARAAA